MRIGTRWQIVGSRLMVLLSQLLILYSPLALSAPTPVLVAPGVYALLGEQGEISPRNRGVVGNAGFIVGDTGVLAVDTGVSWRYGRDMLATIAGVTSLPVQLTVITNPIQEFHFGATAFQERGIPVLAHQKAAELMRQRCETCLKNLRRVLGDEEMRNSKVVEPDQLIEHTTSLNVGGRELQMIYFGWASAPGDLAVFDPTSGVLFAGGLVSVGQIPPLRDADLEGWISALEQLDKLPAKTIVPGHGPVSTPEQARQTLSYLRALRAKVGMLYKSGAGLAEAIARAQLPEFESWSLYGVLHTQNVQQLYLQLEREEIHQEGK